MGFAVDRDTRIFHIGLRCCSADCDSGLGNDTASRESLRYRAVSVYPSRMLSAYTADVTRSDSRRQYGLGIFPDAAGVLIAGNTPNDVYLPSPC